MNKISALILRDVSANIIPAVITALRNKIIIERDKLRFWVICKAEPLGTATENYFIRRINGSTGSGRVISYFIKNKLSVLRKLLRIYKT